MVRFKRLTSEELAILEKKFIHFLSAQSITAPDWLKIKESDAERANDLIDDFSNVVYGSVMHNASFLEKRTTEGVFCYQCLSDRFVLIACITSNNIELSKSREELTGVLVGDQTAKVFTSEKRYSREKEDEVFEMMKQGCEITNGDMFKLLSTML